MSVTQPFHLERRDRPIVISIPHLGTVIPEALQPRYTSEALSLQDTDWHLDRLYDFADRLGATVISAKMSRYVIDVNRAPNGESLYPGMTTTSLCPTETFRGAPLYKPDMDPSLDELMSRLDSYWWPYHHALASEIDRLRGRHPQVLLWEAHSIAGELPRLFDGKLPDFNFGTADGVSCDKRIVAGAVSAVQHSDCSWVVNGRFKGGYITRKYGAPAQGVHAIQLEMCQALYMNEASPYEWREERATQVAPLVQAAVSGALDRMLANQAGN